MPRCFSRLAVVLMFVAMPAVVSVLLANAAVAQARADVAENGASGPSDGATATLRGTDTTRLDEASSRVQIGIGGIFRVGYWTGIRLADAPAAEEATVRSVHTLDGDGVRVHYEQPPAPRWGYVVPGSATAPLELYGPPVGDVRLRGGELIWQGRFSGQAVAPGTPWVVAIGDALGLDAIGRSELLGREGSVAVAQIATAGELPDQAVGWDGVDLLVVSASGAEVLASLDARQIAAIGHWVRTGGRLFVSLGSDAPAMLRAAPWLAELAELPLRTRVLQLDPAPLETYTSSQVPLPMLEGYELPAQGGRTLIAGRTTARQATRLVSERMVGLGRVMVSSFAVDSPEMAAWPQRTLLVTRLHPGLLDIDTQRRRDARTVAAVAYDDLAGQVRASLDRFDSQRRAPFSLVTLILLLLAGLVGPLDYLLINRLLGKPLLGWLSFPLSVLLVSAAVLAIGAGGAAAVAPAAAAPDGSQQAMARGNRIEIIDINAASANPIGRGIGLTHVSSPVAVRLDFDAEVSRQLCKEAGGDAEAHRAEVPETLTGPYAYPGTTFGGISIAGENHTLPPYDISLQTRGVQSLADLPLVGRPLGFPISPAGSKGWMTRWSFEPALGDTAGLSRRLGSEVITGSLTNPLPVDLLNGVLVYGNWAYLLPTRFGTGQRIESIDSLRQKNFRWHLTRREVLESSSRIDTWNVQMDDDLERLTEVLMFESATGGRDYTGLNNRPLAALDLSHVLAHGHAILYGRLASPVLESSLAEERRTVSAVRVILPVAPPSVPAR